VLPVVAGGAERRKPDWPLHSEVVRRMLTVGRESKKEIPVKMRRMQAGAGRGNSTAVDMEKPTLTPRVHIGRLILLPSLLTLAITILRLVGELQQWSKTWFNPAPGGGGAIVGIVWLVPVLGVYFAIRLSSQGLGPPTPKRAIVYAVSGLLILGAGFVLFNTFPFSLPGLVFLWATSALGAAMQRLGWREMFKVLMSYAYAARIPVAMVMFLATRLRWESHYSALAFPPARLNWLAQFFLIGFFPQLVWWVGFTMVVGSVFGSIAAALAQRHRPPQPAPAPS